MTLENRFSCNSLSRIFRTSSLGCSDDWLSGLLLMTGLAVLAGLGMWSVRALAASACCLLLLLVPAKRKWLVYVVVCILVLWVMPTPAVIGIRGWVAPTSVAYFLYACGFLFLISAFQAVNRVLHLAEWQACAVGVSWVVMGGSFVGLPGGLVVVMLIFRAKFFLHRKPVLEEGAFGAFLASELAVIAMAAAHRTNSSAVIWLLPAFPLLIDVAILWIHIVLRRSHAVTAPEALCCEIISTRTGRWQPASTACFWLGVAWFGGAGWWALRAEASALSVASLTSMPVAFAMLVLVVFSNASHEAANGTHSRPIGLVGARLLGLDGLRALAVSLVVMSHAGLMEGGAWEKWGISAVLNAQVGVQIFFVLSGFLITSLLLSEQQRNGRIDLSRFYLRRALRIFPVYYAAIAASFVLAATGIYRIKAVSFHFAIPYLMNFAPWDYMEATFSHFWSLAVEEHFYFIWPLLMVIARGGRMIAATLALVTIVFMGYWSYSPPDFVSMLSANFPVNRWTIPAALPIITGCMVAIVIWQKEPPRWLQAVVGLLGFAVFLFPAWPAVFASVHPAMWPTLSSFAIAGMIAYIVKRQDTRLVALLEWQPLAYVGTISYGIYVWQGIFTGNGSYREVPAWPPEPLLGAGISIVAAIFSYHILEKPILAYKDKLYGVTDVTRTK